MEALWNAGAMIQAYDPVALSDAKLLYGTRNDLLYCTSPLLCLQGADALFIVTEWQEFQTIELNEIKERLREAIVFDGRNIYDPMAMREEGFKYYATGRGDRIAAVMSTPRRSTPSRASPSTSVT